MHRLRLLAPRRPALPREHGAPVPGRPGARPGLGQPPPAVEQHRAGHLGRRRFRKGSDEHLVPEHVAAVGLTVQAAGGDADVEVDAVRGHGLQQVEDVQPQDEDARTGPSISTSQRNQRWSQASSCRARTSSKSPARSISSRAASPGCTDAAVPGRAEGRELLDGDRLPRLHHQRQVDRGEPARRRAPRRPGVRPPSASTRWRAASRSGSSTVWSPRPSVRTSPSDRGLDRRQVPAVEAAVPGHAVVGHPSVQTRADGEPPGPVLGDEGALQCGQARGRSSRPAAAARPSSAVPGRPRCGTGG